MWLTGMVIWMWLIAGGIIAPGTPYPDAPNVQLPAVHIDKSYQPTRSSGNGFLRP